MSRVRIALFVPSLRGGGAEKVMIKLAGGFRERGVGVDLVLGQSVGPYLSSIPPEVRVIDLGASRTVTAIPGLAGYLRRERPAALLSAMKHANIAALIAIGLSGAQIHSAIAEHTTPSVSFSSNRGFMSLILRRLMHMTYPHARGIVAVSDGVLRDLVDSFALDPSRVVRIYNPVVDQELLAQADVPLQHPWFAPEAPPVILGVGRLSPAKGFSALIRAFSEVRTKRPVKLLILGEGEDRRDLEALGAKLGLQSDLSMPGFVGNPYQYMRRSSVFVLSSCWEGFGNVLVEAMACGTPVVSTDCRSGPAEILEGGKWGRLVPVADIDALADAIDHTLENPGPPALSRAREFSVDRAVDAYLSVLLPDRGTEPRGSMDDATPKESFA